MITARTLIVGTRTSNLARWQTEHVTERLQAAWPDLDCQIRPFVTRGDKTLDQPLPEIGGKGLFTLELEEALRSGEIDIAVHSLKDLPVDNAPGLVLGAIIGRADVRDVLVTRQDWTLATLPPGARVGTSSRRRQAQLLAQRPDLTVTSIRGNVETRVRKVVSGEYDAAVLAAAGLARLDMVDRIAEWLPLSVMLPAPGQGALAIQCRARDASTRALLAAIEDAGVRAAVDAERAFLQGLGGGCSAPIGALAVWQNGRLRLEGLVGSPDGQQLVRVAGDGDEPWSLGRQLAETALAGGAATILAALTGGQPLPLQGRRIVVTRSETQADELSTKLRELGAVPVAIPLIRIEPVANTRSLDDALRRLDSYDWVVFTSRNAVEVFWRRLTAVAPEIDWSTVRVAVIGPATGAVVRRHGRVPDYMPGEHVAEALAAGLGDLSSQSVLLPQAALARPALADALRAQGAQVDDLPIYDTVPALPDDAGYDQLAAGVDLVTFTSSSTVRNFIAAIAERPELKAMRFKAACIGPITAQTAVEYRLDVAIVADEYTTDGLVAALVDYYRTADRQS